MSQTEITLSSSADVFSRGSLTLTYELLRKAHPQLALTVRNISQSEPLPDKSADKDNKHTDCFRVELESLQVREVVEALVAASQDGWDGMDNLGRAIMAKALIDEWLALAQKMVADLPEDQRPGEPL